MTSHRKTEGTLEPTLPVTPMLDMAFQLLAFFVMTYHPSDREGQMDLSLPSAEITAPREQDNADPRRGPDSKPIVLPADVTVIVRTQRDNVNHGLISDLSLQDDAGLHPVGNSLNNLRDELTKRSATVENKENINLQADAMLKWQEVVNVMDACHQAGFKNVSFVKPPDHL